MKPLASLFVFLAVLMGAAWPVHAAESYTEFKSVGEQDRQLLALLKSRKFDELDARLTAIVRSYEKDPLREEAVDLAIGVFYRGDPQLEAPLNEWVKAHPKSHVAYLARGTHYTRVGWSLRGTNFASGTSDKQFAGMAENFQRAMADLQQAYALNPQSVHALCGMMDILNGAGARDQVRPAYERALAINPLTLRARSCYLSTITPRWGGSLPQMSKEIEAARPYYEKNPALKTLEGRIAAERGDMTAFSGNYKQAIELYNEALKHGVNPGVMVQRADAYLRSQDIGLAFKDLDAVLEIRPNHQYALYLRGYINNEVGRMNDAIADLTRALELNPYHHRSLFIRGDAYMRQGKSDLAIADFEKAVALRPDEKEYLDELRKARASAKK
jgi:tetratricopeptide (TPR) repeat protein